MASERTYSEAETEEIVQRALADSTSPSGFSRDEVWRIAEEMGVQKAQFETALSNMAQKTPLVKSKSPFKLVNLVTIIHGELDQDGFVLIDEAILTTFGGKKVTYEEQAMKIRLDIGSTILQANIASRKGDTSIRVNAPLDTAFIAALLVLIMFMFVSLFSYILGYSAAWIFLGLAPLFALLTAVLISKRANKSAKDFLDQLATIASQAIADTTHPEIQK